MVLVFVVFCFAKKAGARGYGIKFARGSEQGQREFSFASETRSAFQEKEKKEKTGGKKGKTEEKVLTGREKTKGGASSLFCFVLSYFISKDTKKSVRFNY